MSSAADAKRIGHIAARALAVVGGLLLATSAAFSYFVAGYADDAINAGTGAAEDALRSDKSGLDEKTAGDAADWLHRLSHWAISGKPDEFRTYALIAIAAAIVAVVAAFARRPEAIWPELVWGVTAVAGLAPNLAFDWWFSIWLFTGSLIAAAAVTHFLARRDDHVRHAGGVARQTGAAAAPHVGSALAWGSRTAGDAMARARAGSAGAPSAVPVAAAPPMPGSPAAPPPAAPAGWYADPQRQAAQRWWDGQAWTDRTS